MSEDLGGGFHKAQDSLEDARVLFSFQRYSAVINRCYYAYFYLVRGLLFDKGVFVKTHSGVASKFSELYIKTGEIPAQFATDLTRLSQKRANADYDFDIEITEAEAQEALLIAHAFFSYIQENFQ